MPSLDQLLQAWTEIRREVALYVAVTSGIVGFFAGLIFGIVQKKYGSIWQFLQTICIAIMVAVLMGWAIHDYVASETSRYAIVGVCAWMSDDILRALKSLSSQLAQDPIRFIRDAIAAVRGGAPAVKEEEPK